MKIIVILVLTVLCIPGPCFGECVRGDCQNGEGRLVHKSGVIYEGAFKNGKFYGPGVLAFPNGDQMKGLFRGHYLNEQGVLFPQNNDGKLHFIPATGASALERMGGYVKGTTAGKVILIVLCTVLLIFLLKIFIKPIEKTLKTLRSPKSAEQKQKDELLGQVLREMKDRGKIDPKDMDVYMSLMGEVGKKSKKSSPVDLNGHHQMTIYEAYEVLGVAEGATESEIKAAFREQVMKFHPDRLNRLDDDFKKLARHKTVRLNAAYQMLKEHRQKT